MGTKKRRQRTGKQKRPTSSAPVFSPFESSAVLTRFDRLSILSILLAALLLRITFFFLSKQNNPLFDYPIMDALYHHEWALDILGGNFWGEDVFFRAPLYPYFLALLYKVSGASIAFAIFFQHILGSLSAVLVFLVSRQLFRTDVSLIAGLLAALYWPFIYFEGDLLIVTLILFLNLSALLLFLIAYRRQSLPFYLSAGLLLGLSAIARPTILVFFPIVPLFLHLYRPPNRRSGERAAAWIKQTAVVYIGALILIGPVVVRNYIVGRDIVPIASQGGVNFYIGNNPQSDGRTAVVPGTRWDWWGGYQDAIRMAESARGRSLKPSEVSDYYFERGFAFVFGSPGESLPLLGKKLSMFWAGGERSNNKYIYFFWHKSGMGKVPLPGFWLIAPLGLLGAVLLWRKKPEITLLQMFVASYMIGVVLFFVNARFRLPVVPVLIIFAAYAIAYLTFTFRYRLPDALKAAAILAFCFFIVDFDFVNFGENKVHADSISHYTLGNAYLKDEDTDNAIREYEEALAVYRRYPSPGFRVIERNVHYNLGRLYWGKGVCDKAIPLLEKVGGSDHFSVLTKQCLGDCYVKVDRLVDAIQVYNEIIDVVSDRESVKDNLVQAYLALASQHAGRGEMDKALDLLTRAKTIDPDNPLIQVQIDATRVDP